MELNQLAILFALTISAFPVGAADQPTLSEKLKPLEWMLGRWEMTTNVPNQGTFRLIVEWKPDLGGTVIVQRYDFIDPSNRSVQSGIGLYHWRPEENILAATGAGPTGHGSNLLVKQADNKWIWHSFGYDGKGKFGSGVNATAKDDENTMTTRFYNNVSGGESQPEFTITLKRVATSPEEEIINMEKQFKRAIMQRDLDAFALVVADDYVGSSGEDTWNKEQLMDSIRSGGYLLKALDYHELKARVYGDAAILTCRGTYNEQSGAEESTQEYRVTETWLKRDGRWQVVAFHRSKP
ncbi:MAG: nuclear transport factor 2 family protein [Verrucomicrobiia bacterium]